MLTFRDVLTNARTVRNAHLRISAFGLEPARDKRGRRKALALLVCTVGSASLRIQYRKEFHVIPGVGTEREYIVSSSVNSSRPRLYSHSNIIRAKLTLDYADSFARRFDLSRLHDTSRLRGIWQWHFPDGLDLWACLLFMGHYSAMIYGIFRMSFGDKYWFLRTLGEFRNCGLILMAFVIELIFLKDFEDKKLCDSRSYLNALIYFWKTTTTLFFQSRMTTARIRDFKNRLPRSRGKSSTPYHSANTEKVHTSTPFTNLMCPNRRKIFPEGCSVPFFVRFWNYFEKKLFPKKTSRKLENFFWNFKIFKSFQVELLQYRITLSPFTLLEKIFLQEVSLLHSFSKNWFTIFQLESI